MSDFLNNLDKFNTQIYIDGADLNIVKDYAKNKYVKGFTSNPSLIAASGVSDYESFIKKFLNFSCGKPVSFEVTVDDSKKMIQQAEKISAFDKSIFVKIPIVNSKGESSLEVIKYLAAKKIKLNITALMTSDQAIEVINNTGETNDIILSIFCGRIADTGRDPIKTMDKIHKEIKNCGKNKFMTLWASTREVFNIYQADKCNSNIITVPFKILKKISLMNKNLDEYSKETAKDFVLDAQKAKLEI